MRIALLIEGQAMISLGAKPVRHADWMLSVLEYGKVTGRSGMCHIWVNTVRGFRSGGFGSENEGEVAVSFLVLCDDAKIAGGDVLMRRGLSRDLSDEEVGAQILAVVHGTQNLASLKPKPLAK